LDEWTFYPWEYFKHHKNPQWWQDCQHVKHNRNKYFKKANLENALYALSALQICILYHYYARNKERLSHDYKEEGKWKSEWGREAVRKFNPSSKLMDFPREYQVHFLAIGLHQ